jgi:hypothetical protein
MRKEFENLKVLARSVRGVKDCHAERVQIVEAH